MLHPDEDGRIRAGGVSFPALDPPWRPAPPYLDVDDEIGQELVVGTSGRGPYVACVFIGRLPARHGYAGPPDLATAGQSFAEEVLRTYYPHEHPQDRVVVDDEQVDTHPAWRTEVSLDIEDPTLPFEREIAAVVLVDLGDGTAGVLYASLPAVEPVPRMPSVLAMLRAG